MGGMGKAELIASLKASLGDAAGVFKEAADADFDRHIDAALADLVGVASLVRQAGFDITRDALPGWPTAFAVPSDFDRFDRMLWGQHGLMPWDAQYPGKLPDVVKADINGQIALMLCPLPTAQQLAVCGQQFTYRYHAKPLIGATSAETTLPSRHRGLLILRAQAEAMRELTMRNINKPIQTRDGLTGTPRNSTPAALYQALMAEFQAKVAAL